MSTRSCIIIKVRESDLGKFKKFDPSLLPVKMADWSCYHESEGKELSRKVKLTKPYIGIYCHSDGYPEGVGKVVKETFPSYEQALNLAIGGDCSVVWYDEVRRYGNRAGEDWKWVKPHLGDTPKKVYEKIDCQYCYLFDDDGWKLCKSFERGKFGEYGQEQEIEATVSVYR